MKLVLKNIFYTILQPGIVVGLLPYLLLNRKITFQLKELEHFIGLIVTTLGFIILCSCIYAFIKDSKGTISPADPTKDLVTKGLYKYSRNPMYVGIVTILLGETIYFQSKRLLFYSLLIFILFNLFIKYIEEPRLRRDFGERYQDYKERVRRWM